MLGHEDRETDDQKWITPIEPSVDPHAVNAVLGASIGLFSSFVYGGSGSGSAAVGALSGVMSTYSGVCREHLDAWISMIELQRCARSAGCPSLGARQSVRPHGKGTP